ncbi:MAG: hypothetical protein AABX27_06035 [Nanoarchaeota archaeon]
MNAIHLLKALERCPLFTINEFIRVTGSSAKYARNHIYRLKKAGLVFQIQKGKYTLHTDPLIYASHITIPSYISFWTAIRHYNLTEQLPNDIMVASARPKKQLTVQGIKIKFYKLKEMWGYKKERYAGIDIFIAEKEKAVIDAMLIRNMPFDEAAKAISSKEIDANKLIEYSIKAGSKSAMKRIGWLLEHYGFNADALSGKIDNNYIALGWDMAKKGKKDKKWKIIINWREDAFS